MKKFLIASNVFLLITVYFFACTSKGKLATNEDGSYKIPNAPNFSSCYNCLTDDIHGETASEFANVTARYRSTHFTLYNAMAKNQLSATSMVGFTSPNYNKTNEFEDARSCWFSADTLKKFICLMEKYANDIKIPSSNLGIRFYYANYDNVKVFEPTYSNHHTLYMVPTVFDRSSQNFVDFEPRESAKAGNIVSISKFINKETNTWSTKPLFIIGGKSSTVKITQADGTTTNVSTNQGDLCPPKRGCKPTLDAVDNVFRAPTF
jgi:hypothetical protein